MSNTQECTKQLKRYLIARIPLIVVNTIERSRILEILRADLQSKCNNNLK